MTRTLVVSLIVFALTSDSCALESVPTEEADALKREFAALAEVEDMGIVGKDGWMFLRKELRSFAMGEFWGEAAQKANSSSTPTSRDPLAAIVAYKELLDAVNIELLVVPIPFKCAIYPDKLSDSIKDGAGRVDLDHQAFYAVLKEKGIEVLDLVPMLMKARESAQVYCRTDSHYSPHACVLVAKAIADEIKKRNWYEAVPRTTFKAETRTQVLTGDLLREYQGTDKPEPESVPLTFVTMEDGAPIENNPDSPVVFLTDSHGGIFHAGGDMLSAGAGLFENVCGELGFAVDLKWKRGSAATPVRVDFYRRARQEPGYLAKKKIMVYLFTVREFTDSSWNSAVPVDPDRKN